MDNKTLINNRFKVMIFLLILFLSLIICGSASAAQVNNTISKISLNSSTAVHSNSTVIKKVNVIKTVPVNNSNTIKYLLVDKSILPSYYDLRMLGKLTPVGDQGSSGVCWAFASLGSLESCLLPNETWNFSENNMKNVLSNSDPQGFDRYANDAGSWEEATAYLTRYSGPVTGTQDPFNEDSSYSTPGLNVVKHVQDTVLIDPRNSTGIMDNDQLKNAIMEYGAVYSLMTYDDSYLNPITYGYLYNGTLNVNHAVDIVGWDDNYSKDNFINGAPGNGAFIVRNSWGSEWGDNGYFYVSYYDKYLANSDYNVIFMDAEPTTNYDNIYQYDPFGVVGNLGYNSNVGWFSNIFKSNGNEKLEASSFYVFSPNTTYQIYVYLNPSSLNPQDGILADFQSGTISTEGYKTIQLDKIVQLLKGEKFSIVVRLTTPDDNYPVTIEYPEAGYSSKATANPGESYVSADGNTWEDLTSIVKNANVCLKAFTVGKPADLAITQKIKTIKDGIYKVVFLKIFVKNNGPGISFNTNVTDFISSKLTYISYISSYGKYNMQTGLWNIGTLPNGAVAIMTIKCILKNTNIFNNMAVVSSLTYDPNLNNNIINITGSFKDQNTFNITENKNTHDKGVKFIPMQKTGLPLAPLIAGLFIIIVGLTKTRKH